MISSGWWFGTFFIFHILGIVTPADFHIFQRGRSTTSQSLMLEAHFVTILISRSTSSRPIFGEILKGSSHETSQCHHPIRQPGLVVMKKHTSQNNYLFGHGFTMFYFNNPRVFRICPVFFKFLQDVLRLSLFLAFTMITMITMAEIPWLSH